MLKVYILQSGIQAAHYHKKCVFSVQSAHWIVSDFRKKTSQLLEMRKNIKKKQVYLMR